MFDIPQSMGGSGLFVCEQLLFRPVEITSPYVRSSTLEVADWSAGAEANTFVSQMKQSQGVFPVVQPIVSRYAAKIVEVSRIVKESAYDIVLCPLRGARMPGLQADVMCETEPFQAFDGADMAQGVNDERILRDLRRLILERPLNCEQRKIGVLDTAVGGDSCCQMARLLRRLNDEASESWAVHFHLIHAEDRQPSRANGAYSFSGQRFGIQIKCHAVTELLIEDESRLLGYDVSRAGGQSHIVRFRQEGQILLYGGERATLYRAAPLDETMIAIVGAEISRLIQSLPDIKPLNLDYWPYGA